jgi:two-component system OmpR family sensor kinase
VKRPLFWKLLIGAWVSLILVAAGNALVFGAFVRSMEPWGRAVLERVESQSLATAAEILKAQGPAAVVAHAAHLPAGDQLVIVPGGEPATIRPSDRNEGLSQVVHAPSGTYTLTYRASLSLFGQPVPRVMLLPLQLLGVDFVGVSIFSVLIARYLADPIQRLRGGMERVAEGDLSVRVYADVARRRDELAELARIFDVMAERLQQLLEARERLLHDVSHEFRSPLTRLLLAVELARRTPERSMASLERIEREAQRLNDMVGELLTLSRAEFTAARSETYFAVADLLAAVVADAAFEAEAKGVTVTAEVSAGEGGDGVGPVINGSPELLRKGIDNVLRNAVKVSRPGQTVSVRLGVTGPAPGRLRIEVSDQGPGVPEADLKRIFEPFVRLEGMPQGTGFGLGLAIARSAAQAHRGVVSAVNRPRGGLTVAFELPVGAAAPVEDAATEPAAGAVQDAHA